MELTCSISFPRADPRGAYSYLMSARISFGLQQHALLVHYHDITEITPLLIQRSAVKHISSPLLYERPLREILGNRSRGTNESKGSEVMEKANTEMGNEVSDIRAQLTKYSHLEGEVSGSSVKEGELRATYALTRD